MKGGKQPGAGRPKGTIAKSTMDAIQAKAYMISRITAELDPLMTAMLDKAKVGDTTALKECWDRLYGKAPQAVEVSGALVLEIDI